MRRNNGDCGAISLISPASTPPPATAQEWRSLRTDVRPQRWPQMGSRNPSMLYAFSSAYAASPADWTRTCNAVGRFSALVRGGARRWGICQYGQSNGATTTELSARRARCGHTRRRWLASANQQGDKLKVPDNISLLSLPSYSPELNPQENIWQFLRKNYLANRVYDTYAELVDACCEVWNALIATPQRT
jgi:hypothetical protein